MITSFKTIKLFALTLLIAGLCVQTAFTLSANESMELTTAEIDFIDVTGTVTDESGDGLVGATILEKGTTNGTISDINGNYTLEVADENATLVISYIGQETQEVEIGGRAVIDVVMTASVSALDEVVVVGYGTQKKENLTGAVSTVSAEMLDGRPITSVATALQGTTTGVFINQNSGQAGRDDVIIRIRGVGTLNNSEPLILVDGIEAPIGNINPQDIESMTILKDAASSAIYGSRAANGVVLITTKRGKLNSKPTFTYDGYYGSQESIRLPEMVNDGVLYATLRNEARTNYGDPEIYSPAQLAEMERRAAEINTNWIDELFSTAPIQQHTFSMDGGGETTNFRLSLGYLDQEGTIIRSDFKRYNARLNLDSKINDKVTIGTSLSLIRGDKNSTEEDLSVLGTIFTGGVIALPFYPVRDSQGRFADENIEMIGSSSKNPIAKAFANNVNVIDNHVLGNAYLEYEPIDGLKLKGTMAVNYRTTDFESFGSKTPTYDFITGENNFTLNAVRSASRRHVQTLNITTWLTATYTRSFGLNNLTALAGFNQEESETRDFRAGIKGHLSNSVRVLDIGDASTATNQGSATEWGLRSYFGRVNYDYDGKYLFEANVRVDGSSRFLNDKWGTFPSFSAGWVMSNEDFLQNAAIVDFLKIRASWGQLGNQNIGNFTYAKQLSLSQAYNFGGSVVSGVAQTTLGNEDLTWETSTMTNIGIDLAIFNNFNIVADYFIRDTKDILFEVPISSLSGFNSQISNASTVRNEGWELGVDYDQNFSDFRVTVGGNVSHVNSVVTILNPGIAAGEVDRLISGRRIIERGSPINALYGLRSIGIFQTDAEVAGAPDHLGLNRNFGAGDLRFEDINGDGVIDADDRVVIGKDDPTWTYGFTFSVAWRGFDIAGIFQGASDFNSYGYGEISQPFFNTAGLHTSWLNRWTPENPNTSVPRIYDTSGPSTAMDNSYFVLDRSYFRFKNLQIGYNFPASITDKTFVSRLRVFVNGTNLFTSTDFPFLDPERRAGASRGATSFPNSRVITGGISVSF